MKVLFVHRVYGKEKISPVVDNQIKSLNNLGLIEIHKFNIEKGGFEYFRRTKELRSYARKNGIDIIHAHYSFCGFFSALGFTGLPIVCSLMGSDVLRSRLTSKFIPLFSRFFWKEVIVKSPEMQVLIRRSHLIPNGVDFNNFRKLDRETSKKKVGFDKNKFNIIFVATNPDVTEKNLKLAIESVRLLSDKIPNAKLEVVSKANFETLPYYYNAADLLLLTSLSEGSPNVIKEALACGCPIVATNVGDVSLSINGIPNCYLTSFDANEIASKIEQCLLSGRRIENNENILHLNNEVIAGKIIQLYQKHCKSFVPLSKNICSKGVWDETIPGITFDKDNVSNYAHLFMRLCDAYPRGNSGKQEWSRIVDKIKERGKNKPYDCVIGVSGGTDSCYLLHLAKQANLRPLAVHLDNGWDSEIAVGNIEKLTSQLGIDLKTFVINYEEIKDLLRSYMMAGLPWIDMPTDLAIKAILYKIASKENIKYILRGNDFRTEGTQPKEWTYGDGRQLNHVHKRFGSIKLKTYPNYTLQNLLYYGLFKQIKSIYPYYYLNYNKSEAQEYLIKNYGWRYYGGHHHENLFTKFAITYWLPHKFNIDKRKITLSALAMSGELSRQEALDKLLVSPYNPEEINETIAYIQKKLDITNEQFTNILGNKNKNYTDYPSYDFIMKKMMGIGKPILKLLFVHKPQSVFQSEMRGGN